MSLTNKKSYRYHLPSELIAQFPPDKRDDCHLMHLERHSGKVNHHGFSDFNSFLKPGDVMVLNSSKVIPARLKGKKDTGGSVEVLLLRELQEGIWECLVRPGSRVKEGSKIIFTDALQGKITGHLAEGLRIIEFHYSKDFWQLLDSTGKMPLPPYIKRDASVKDLSDYQTVYARERGSAAAPTAGLHFTDGILKSLAGQGVIITNVVLHIGLDTFRPVKVENILEHKMHREFCTVPLKTADIINQAKREGRRIIAIGTTTVRTLESFAVCGSSYSEQVDKTNFIESGSKWTDIFIYPGFEFKITDGLLTNFHLPESTLLMMISAYAGYENTLNAYKAAVQERYRFFSYGDAMLIL